MAVRAISWVSRKLKFTSRFPKAGGIGDIGFGIGGAKGARRRLQFIRSAGERLARPDQESFLCRCRKRGGDGIVVGVLASLRFSLLHPLP
jgi:hypothetical protein